MKGEEEGGERRGAEERCRGDKRGRSGRVSPVRGPQKGGGPMHLSNIRN